MEETPRTRAYLPSGQIEDWALFLDIDGTLLDIAPTPDQVVVPTSLGVDLAALDKILQGAIALISGRTLPSIDRIFHPLHLAAAGQHGAEIRLPRSTVACTEISSAALQRLRKQIERAVLRVPGIVIEDKGLGLAVHYRQAPTAQGELLQSITEVLAGYANEFEVLHGKMVIEIKSGAANKGRAVATFMQHRPFADRVPIFVGDDRTDEDGFAVVTQFGGCAIRVGPEHAGAKDYWLPDPSSVRAWLHTLAERDSRHAAKQRGRDARPQSSGDR